MQITDLGLQINIIQMQIGKLNYFDFDRMKMPKTYHITTEGNFAPN